MNIGLRISAWPSINRLASSSTSVASDFRFQAYTFFRSIYNKMSGDADEMKDCRPFPHFATDAIHAGQEPEKWKSRAVVPPISMATTFKQFGPAEHAGFEYSRSGNPTRNCLEECIAALEGAKYAMTFSSGLATTGCLTQLLNSGDHIISVNDVYGAMTFSSGLATTGCLTQLLNSGDHIISVNDVYGGTNRYFRQVASRMNFEISFVDATDLKQLDASIKPNTKMVWIETPTNPTMKLVDLQAVSKLAKEKMPNAFVVCDNTFMSSYFQRPLELGIDIVMHSLTKYMNGHSDTVMGAVALNDDQLAERIRFLQNAIGSVPSPFDSYLCNRGLKTLPVRMREHMKNGLIVARFLESNSRVTKVIHPGLPSHPQHELAKRQMRGYSGMVSFYLKGGLQESKVFLQSLKIFTLAESLGGFESLAELPSVMTHASVSEKERAELGVTDSLIRLSVGLEDIEDIIKDIDEALKTAIP